MKQNKGACGARNAAEPVNQWLAGFLCLNALAQQEPPARLGRVKRL